MFVCIVRANVGVLDFIAHLPMFASWGGSENKKRGENAAYTCNGEHTAFACIVCVGSWGSCAFARSGHVFEPEEVMREEGEREGGSTYLCPVSYTTCFILEVCRD